MTTEWCCDDVYLSETDVLILKTATNSWCGMTAAGTVLPYEMIQWQEKPGPHISRKNKSKYFFFIVVWVCHASGGVCNPPIGNSTVLISSRRDQTKRKQKASRENCHGPTKHQKLKKSFCKAEMKTRGLYFIAAHLTTVDPEPAWLWSAGRYTITTLSWDK